MLGGSWQIHWSYKILLNLEKNAAKYIIEDIGVLFYLLFYFTVRVMYSSNMYKIDRNSESTVMVPSWLSGDVTNHIICLTFFLGPYNYHSPVSEDTSIALVLLLLLSLSNFLLSL